MVRFRYPSHREGPLPIPTLVGVSFMGNDLRAVQDSLRRIARPRRGGEATCRLHTWHRAAWPWQPGRSWSWPSPLPGTRLLYFCHHRTRSQGCPFARMPAIRHGPWRRLHSRQRSSCHQESSPRGRRRKLTYRTRSRRKRSAGVLAPYAPHGLGCESAGRAQMRRGRRWRTWPSPAPLGRAGPRT